MEVFQSDSLPQMKVTFNNLDQLKDARKRQRSMQTRQDRSAVVDDVTSVMQSYYYYKHIKNEYVEAYGPVTDLFFF